MWLKKKTEREKKIKDNKINIHALKTKKNNRLIRQEYHNSSKPIQWSQALKNM